ncbi:MAG: hypothetical protein JXQ96_16815 [Cyclobacteriaceae bacterium]
MMNLITIVGKSARYFHLPQRSIPDFKSLMRTVTSGRVAIISTKFRSDLFYHAETPNVEAILKMWALHASTEQSLLEDGDLQTTSGNEASLGNYFQSINKISRNWYRYWFYKKAFSYTYKSDQENPLIRSIVECDHYLLKHTKVKRAPLISSSEKGQSEMTNDTFALAMHIINNETHLN